VSERANESMMKENIEKSSCVSRVTYLVLRLSRVLPNCPFICQSPLLLSYYLPYRNMFTCFLRLTANQLQ